jgi:transposase-like protein
MRLNHLKAQSLASAPIEALPRDKEVTMPTVISTHGKANGPVNRIWPVERKLDFVLEGLRGQRSVAELCREAGISPTRYYRWRQEVIDAARIGLTHPEAEQSALQERIKQLEAEVAHLQRQTRVFQELCVAD